MPGSDWPAWDGGQRDVGSQKGTPWTVDGHCQAGWKGDSLISGRIHFLIAHSRLPRFLPLLVLPSLGHSCNFLLQP